MTTRRIVFGAIVLTSSVMANATQAYADSTANPVEGSYLVWSTGGKFPADFSATVAALGGRVTFTHDGAGVGAVSGLEPKAAARLAKLRGIAAVEADDFTTIPRSETYAVDRGDSSSESVANPETAARFARQWHLRQIEAPAAWAAGRLGETYTKVGILDSGLGYTHVDLDGRVDLNLSRSFIPFDDQLVQLYFPGAHPIADLDYHGTHVGATVVSNAVRAAGVASRLTLVGIKVCSVQGFCPTSAVLQGVLYAADIGLPVANMSLGGYFDRREASARGGLSPSFIAIINRVFNYAYTKGTLVVVSAGNSAIDIDHDKNGYKAYCSAPHVVCVAATGPTNLASTNGPWTEPDAPAYYSNFGRSAIDVAAPGGNGEVNFSYVWAACSPFSLLIDCRSTVPGQPASFILGLGGTSMAAPHVAGTAALISEEIGRNPAQIRMRLEQSADDLGEPGVDPAYGKGRINVRRALGL